MSDTSFYDERVYEEKMNVLIEQQRPFYMLRPSMMRIGELWRAQYGDVSACGKSPQDASIAFDTAWSTGKDQAP